MNNNNNTSNLWLNAYNQTFKMMKLRGFTLIPDDEDNILSQADLWNVKWEKINNAQNEDDPYLFFHKDNTNEISIVGFFVGDLDKANVQRIMLKLETYKQIDTAIIIRGVIVAREVRKGHAKNLFIGASPTIIPRTEQNPNISQLYVDVFSLSEMQYCPLEHKLQPKTELITKENIKEKIRLQLTSVLEDDEKTISLYDLLPMEPSNNIVPRWFGAMTGDIIKYTRRIGGKNTYYRIIVPPSLDSRNLLAHEIK